MTTMRIRKTCTMNTILIMMTVILSGMSCLSVEAFISSSPISTTTMITTTTVPRRRRPVRRRQRPTFRRQEGLLSLFMSAATDNSPNAVVENVVLTSTEEKASSLPLSSPSSSSSSSSAGNSQDDDDSNIGNAEMMVDPSSSTSSVSSSTSMPTTTTTIITTTTTMTIFDQVAYAAATCLMESDKRRDANHQAEHSNLRASSATNWIHDASSGQLQDTLNQLQIQLPSKRHGINRDVASNWIRWMKLSPIPIVIDLSSELQQAVVDVQQQQQQQDILSRHNLESIDQTQDEFLNRLGCRLVLLPSGSKLMTPLREPPASLIYGTLLYGGITRYRRLIASHGSNNSISSSSNGSGRSSRTNKERQRRGRPRPRRKAGERTDIKTSVDDHSIPTWLQYGGTERMYEAVDIGPAAILEVVLLPRGQDGQHQDGAWSSSNDDIVDDINNSRHSQTLATDMVIRNLAWKPQDIFEIIPTAASTTTTANDNNGNMDYISGCTPISQSGKDRNDAFEKDFKEAVGGLQPQIDAIVRRVLDGRVLRPAQDDGDDDDSDTMDETSAALNRATLEARELELLGLTPVRGLLLYGLPGTGKTLLARQIAKALRARTPKIVSAPELLDRWVGGSEKLVRELFADAEAELALCGGDATKSALHVVVVDEIDAVFRRRSAGEDSGEQTRASVVNQILSKLDGVHAIDNVLMIGMTNRRELLDEALLRPGRLEVQIEVPLPDQEGRREILQIHFDALRRKGRLSQPLCCAIDGVPYTSSSFSTNLQSSPQDDKRKTTANDSSGTQRQRKRDTFQRGLNRLFQTVRPYPDLAAETSGFSGADLAGLVRSAGSLALARARQDGSGLDGLLITLQDARDAMKEVKV